MNDVRKFVEWDMFTDVNISDDVFVIIDDSVPDDSTIYGCWLSHELKMEIRLELTTSRKSGKRPDIQ